MVDCINTLYKCFKRNLSRNLSIRKEKEDKKLSFERESIFNLFGH
jgi:hypothetical protein